MRPYTLFIFLLFFILGSGTSQQETMANIDAIQVVDSIIVTESVHADTSVYEMLPNKDLKNALLMANIIRLEAHNNLRRIREMKETIQDKTFVEKVKQQTRDEQNLLTVK